MNDQTIENIRNPLMGKVVLDLQHNRDKKTTTIYFSDNIKLIMHHGEDFDFDFDIKWEKWTEKVI